MTPWWLRPTAEGANEEKDEKQGKPQEQAIPQPPIPAAPEPQTQNAVAPESAPLASPSVPSADAEPDWRHEPVPEFEPLSPVTPAAREAEPEPESRYYARPEEPEPIAEEPAAAEEDEEEDEEDDEIVAAEGAESPAAEGEAAREGRRRRPRRSRGRRKEGRAAAPAPTADAEEDEEPVREEPVYEEPAPRRVAALAPLAPPVLTPAETISREIVITMPERQRMADERKIAMFCDLENIALGVRDSEVGKFDIELILERLLEKGKIIVKKAYADWERYSEYKRPFHESAIELIDIPQKYYSGKNSADIKMVVDAMDLSYSKEHLDTFVILSGDSDFSPLVSKLKENNKYVIGVGVKNSSSALLIDNCDEFLYYEDVWRDTQKGPNLDGLNKKTAEAFSLMIDAIQALLRENKDVLWGSMIKQTMQRKKPSFNEGYYGYPSFSELLEDAERKNIIRLKKDQRSGTYVVTGFAKGTEAPASTGRR
ncbi:MAG: NYN domain-containing protein [Acidobacteriota bacterium]